MKLEKTFLPKADQIDHKVYIIDATDKILGHVAAKAASIIRGKHKAIFTPHLETGDSVIIINAEKIRVSGKKLTDKFYRKYSGYPSGQKLMSLGNMLKTSPETVLHHAVDGMIPKGRLGNKLKTRLRVYAGDQHPHQAQKPIPLEV